VFDLIDAGSVDPLNGTFSVVDVEGLASPLDYSIQCTPRWRVQRDGEQQSLAVPEPSTWAMMIGGLVLLAWRARRPTES